MEWTRSGYTPKVGDTISVPVPVYRRWWQIWRPRIVGSRRERYVVVSSHTADGKVATWPMLMVD